MGIEVYPIEIKLAVVRYIVEEGHTQREAAEKYGVSLTPVGKWVNLYRQHGEEGLKSRNLWDRQQCFTGEFKLRVLEYMVEHQLSYTQTAAVFCIDVVTVSKWAKLYWKEGAQALLGKRPVVKKQPKNKGTEISQQEMKRLQEENLYLRMENDYLKKLNALIQKEEKSAKKNG